MDPKIFSILLILQTPFFVSSLNASVCDTMAGQREEYRDYFNSMKKIYSKTSEEGTCVPVHRQCGWPAQNPHIPQYVLVIGLEGSGHHFWTELYVYMLSWAVNTLIICVLD